MIVSPYTCEVGLIFLAPPKRTPNIYTHQSEQGALCTLTKNSNINPASCHARITALATPRARPRLKRQVRRSLEVLASRIQGVSACLLGLGFRVSGFGFRV